MVAWAVLSITGLPPLDGALPAGEAIGPLTVLASISVALYAFAAIRTLEFYRRRGGVVILAIGVALVLLGEAMVAVVLSRNWRLSWWEWHVLMLLAFLAIAAGARSEYRRSGSLTAAFGGLYLDATLARLDQWHARAIAAVAAAEERGEPTRPSSTTSAGTARAATRSPSSSRRPARSAASTASSGRTSRRRSRSASSTSRAAPAWAASNGGSASSSPISRASRRSARRGRRRS